MALSFPVRYLWASGRSSMNGCKYAQATTNRRKHKLTLTSYHPIQKKKILFLAVMLLALLLVSIVNPRPNARLALTLTSQDTCWILQPANHARSS